MKEVKDILFVIQARLNSQRVPNKMLRPFAGTNLFELGLQKLLQCTCIPTENLYVSIYEDGLVRAAKKYNVNIFRRSYESANNDNSLKTIYEWHDKLPFKYVIKVNPCSPLLKVETIQKFIDTFLLQESESLFSVIPYKDYFWSKEGRLITPWPEDQTIMNTKAVDLTYKAGHVLYASRMDLIRENKFMGDFKKEGGITLFPMNELEAFDIDYEWQFQVGEYLFSNFYHAK
jgi:CMP-N-acetylneuraminic acid synthetase